MELWQWQRELMDILCASEGDDRKVFWVCDFQGGIVRYMNPVRRLNRTKNAPM